MEWARWLARLDLGNYINVVFDILAIAWLVYRLLLLAKGTRAMQIIGGLLIFFTAVFVTERLNLYALNWLLREAFVLGPVAVVVLFLPELRHALEEFGRPGFWGRSFSLHTPERMVEMVDAVVEAVALLSVKRVGALIVFERETQLEDIISTGTQLNATVTPSLLCTVFQKGTPLHDGAVVIREGILSAAGCTLPLTATPKIEAAAHTRHKAALGMSEESDAVVVVVSEETGTISIAVESKLYRGLRDDTLRERLCTLLQISDNHNSVGASIGQVATRARTVIAARKGPRAQDKG